MKDSVTLIRQDRTLEDTAWRVIAPLLGSMGRAREIAEKQALVRPRASLFDALAAYDSDWLLAHVEEIAKANPDRRAELARAIQFFLPQGVDGKAALAQLA